MITPEHAFQTHADLLDMPIDFFAYDTVAQRVWQLRHNVTAYDAAYVAPAEFLDAPLLSLDLRLATAPGIGCRVEVPD